MNSLLFTLLLLSYLATAAMIFSILAVKERDLLKAVIYSAVQSIAYAIMFGILMAPDVLYAYVAVGVGIYPALLVIALAKTYRFEGERR